MIFKILKISAFNDNHSNLFQTILKKLKKNIFSILSKSIQKIKKKNQ